MNKKDFCLLMVLLRTRNKYVSINIQKMKLLAKTTQSYLFETLSSMPHFQNSIGNLPFLSVFGNSKSDWNIKIA